MSVSSGRRPVWRRTIASGLLGGLICLPPLAMAQTPNAALGALPSTSASVPAASTAPTASQSAAATATASDPRGRWITANGNLEVEIAPCGAALCGTVTKVLGNKSMSRDGGEMVPVDTRPALGMVLLRDFARSDSGDAASPPTEWSGEIYNRENGKTYSCHMSVGTEGNPAGELVLRAYVGIPLFGKTQRWQRVGTP